MLNFIIPTSFKLYCSLFNGLVMVAYSYISSVIAPWLVLKLEPELLTFTATEMAPNMAEAMESMPNMETLMKLANHITMTTLVISAVAAYLLACVVAKFVQFKQSNKSHNPDAQNARAS